MENTLCKVCTGLTVENGKCRNCGAEEATTTKKTVTIETPKTK